MINARSFRAIFLFISLLSFTVTTISTHASALDRKGRLERALSKKKKARKQKKTRKGRLTRSSRVIGAISNAPLGFTPIKTYDDLDNIRKNTEVRTSGESKVTYIIGKYFLCNDITIPSSKKFAPIGAARQFGETIPFAGIFDGNNKMIKDLVITEVGTASSSGPTAVGLFPYISEEAIVRNLRLDSPRITGNIYLGADKDGTISIDGSYVGAIGGLVQGTISNVRITGNAKIWDGLQRPLSVRFGGNRSGSAGAVAGYLFGGEIRNAFVQKGVQVEAHDDVGGIAGFVDTFRPSKEIFRIGKIINSYSAAEVKATMLYGGIAGENYGDILASASEGIVSGISTSSVNKESVSIAGGIAGYNSGNIKDCRVTNASISGEQNIGGLAGISLYGYNPEFKRETLVTRSLSHGSISGMNNVGGLIGTLLKGGGLPQGSLTSLVDCAAYGNVLGRTNAGALIGSVDSLNGQKLVGASTVINLSGPSEQSVGGLIGKVTGPTYLQGAFFLSESGKVRANEYGALPKTSAELKSISTYKDVFDISYFEENASTTWKIPQGGAGFAEIFSYYTASY